MQFFEKQLDNGLQIVAELNPSVHSVAVGFFVRTGARDESPEVNGVSHFLEHMAFKGNDVYTADDVNRIFDEIGAKYNASTSEEVTLFYGAILPEYLPKAFELLSALLFPSLRQEDFDMEKNVILEEISMYDDQPVHVAYENSMLKHFAGHPLGTSILGSLESVSNLSSEQMRKYHEDHYRGGNITLAVTGNTTWEDVLKLAQQYCSEWPAGKLDRPTHEATPRPGVEVIHRDNTIQQTIMQMHPGPPSQSEMRVAAEILSLIIGDDGGSRIYWDLVDPGFVESADLSYYEYDGSGVYLTYLGCEPETAKQNLDRIHAIYQAVNDDGVTEVELEQAKNKYASRIVLRSERPMGRLSSLGSNWLYRQEYRSVADDLGRLQSTSLDDIRQCLDEYPLGGCTTVCVGPLKEFA